MGSPTEAKGNDIRPWSEPLLSASCAILVSWRLSPNPLTDIAHDSELIPRSSSQAPSKATTVRQINISLGQQKYDICWRRSPGFDVPTVASSRRSGVICGNLGMIGGEQMFQKLWSWTHHIFKVHFSCYLTTSNCGVGKSPEGQLGNHGTRRAIRQQTSCWLVEVEEEYITSFHLELMEVECSSLD